MGYAAPDSYPQEHVTNKVDGVDTIYPIEVTYDCLRRVCIEAAQKLESGTWTTTTVTSYLKRHGINPDSIDALTERSLNIRALAEAEKNHDDNPSVENAEILEALREEKEDAPDKFLPWQYPAPWEAGIHLHQCHQAGMHLLFLGIVKTMCFVIQDWASRRKKFAHL